MTGSSTIVLNRERGKTQKKKKETKKTYKPNTAQIPGSWLEQESASGSRERERSRKGRSAFTSVPSYIHVSTTNLYLPNARDMFIHRSNDG